MKAAGILRESSEKQARDGRQGLEQQKREIADYAQELSAEVTCWEQAVESASRWDRPDWEAIIDRVIQRHQRGEIDAIIFDRVDRETRNLFASVPILTRALRAGIEVHFAAEKLLLDPRDPKSLDRYLDKADESRAYVKAISNSWRRVHHNRAKAGKHPTKQNLWGFRYNGELRVADEATVPISHEAIKKFLRDKFLSTVVRWLQKDCGVTTLNSASALRRWLQNPALKGETHACGEVIRHEGLMSSTEWDEVQAILKQNSGRRPPRKGYLPIPFQCGCGARMKADKHGPRIYVHCPRCHKPYLRLDRLLPMINLATVTYIQDKRDFFGDLSVKAEIREGVLAELDEISRALNSIEARWKSIDCKLEDAKLREWQRKILEEEERSLISQHTVLEERQNRLLDKLQELPEIQVIDIQQAWDEVVRPYKVYFAPLTPNLPTLDEQKPEEQALRLLFQNSPSSFYKINNLKPFYLNPIGGPKRGEGCVIPEPPPTQGAGMANGWDSGEFNPPEQFKSILPPLDGWVWDFLRDLRAEAVLIEGRLKLRFHLKVIPHRLNETPRARSSSRWGQPPMLPRCFMAPPGMMPRCWRRQSGAIWNWGKGTASSATSATTGRRSPNTIPII